MLADAPHLPQLNELQWKGTRHLTCRALRCGEHRLLKVGDAVGYVEPFTGEGIEWALASALRVAPIAMEALRDWDDRLVSRWQAEHRGAFAGAHRRCQLLTAGLRRPWLVRPAVRLLQTLPALGDGVSRWFHRGRSTGMSPSFREAV